MSLFPAYSAIPTPSADDARNKDAQPDASWLTNPSFEQLPNSTPAEPIPIEIDDRSSSPISPQHSPNTQNAPSLANATSISVPHKKSSKSKTKEKHKKRDKTHRRPKSPVPAPIVFTGTEEYYVDKKSERGFLSVLTLHRPACPKYRIYLRSLGAIPRSNRTTSGPIRRYYLKGKREKIAIGDRDDIDRLSEEDFVNQNRTYNKQLGENPGDIGTWCAFVVHQEKTSQKVTKLQVAERKLAILDKALRENAGNDRLYGVYVDVLERTYPSFEVSKLLDGLLAKDPTNYTLWNAQVLATQGSMARCIVPDVLKLYEQCMKHMYKRTRYDQVMLKLFTSCGFFLRQAGLAEQLFALIKLGLELNVSANQFHKIQPLEQDQHTLVDYEEVVLASGLPMNEIWLRIEKLRQNFYFLPCPENRSCPDPQRIVFNEDIVHFVYPLSAQRTLAFELVVRVMHLLKIPLPVGRHDSVSHFDAIEEVLSVLMFKPFLDCPAFDASLVELVREFSSGPSFVRTHIGHDIYTNVLTEFLFLFAEAMPQQRVLFLRLWMRFERILIAQERLLHKPLGIDRAKKLRAQIKSLLKRDENRNETVLYTEYALIEHELGDSAKTDAIFEAAIAQSSDARSHDAAAACVAYVELLMQRGHFDRAVAVLVTLSLSDKDQTSTEPVAEYRKLQARKWLADQCKAQLDAVREATTVELEQSFCEAPVITYVKAKVYLLVMTRSKSEAIQEIEVALRSVPEATDSHRLLRERLFEVYANVLQVAHGRGGVSANLLLFDVLRRGLAEFPDNLVLVRFAVTLDGQTWFRVRSLLTRSPSAVSIVFLVAAARYRYMRYQEAAKFADSAPSSAIPPSLLLVHSSDIDTNEFAFKTRVCNLLRQVTNKNSALRKNALLWRIYLRSLLDVNKDFEQSRNALFGALDECPWNKALYLDGSVYVPQELSHIQDLIIEKQLRIYALPEELEILRNDDLVGAAGAVVTT